MHWLQSSDSLEDARKLPACVVDLLAAQQIVCDIEKICHQRCASLSRCTRTQNSHQAAHQREYLISFVNKPTGRGYGFGRCPPTWQRRTRRGGLNSSYLVCLRRLTVSVCMERAKCPNSAAGA